MKYLTGFGEYGRTWLLDHPDPRPKRTRMAKKTTRKAPKKKARKKAAKKKAKARAKRTPRRNHNVIERSLLHAVHDRFDRIFLLIAQLDNMMGQKVAAIASLGLRLAEIVNGQNDPIVRASIGVLLGQSGAEQMLAVFIARHMSPPVETNA